MLQIEYLEKLNEELEASLRRCWRRRASGLSAFEAHLSLLSGRLFRPRRPRVPVQPENADENNAQFIQEIQGATHQGHIDHIRSRCQDCGQNGDDQNGIAAVAHKGGLLLPLRCSLLFQHMALTSASGR